MISDAGAPAGMPDAAATEARRVVAIAPPVPAGMAGLRLQRMIGTPALGQIDPFLLLSEFGHPERDGPLGGFPEHPHRGFETVTYMVEGAMRHRDSTGAEGLIGPGGAQWMTAARGVLHSEFPEPDAAGRVLGVQLWLNLPARLKMTPATYRDLDASEIPEVALPDGGRVRVIAGEIAGAAGPMSDGAVAPVILDLRLPAGARADLPLPAGHNAFVYAIEGSPAVGESDPVPLPAKHLGVLDGGGRLVVANPGETEAILLVAAARPLDEPVVAYGPFVMNTEQEIYQAFKDFQRGGSRPRPRQPGAVLRPLARGNRQRAARAPDQAAVPNAAGDAAGLARFEGNHAPGPPASVSPGSSTIDISPDSRIRISSPSGSSPSGASPRSCRRPPSAGPHRAPAGDDVGPEIRR